MEFIAEGYLVCRSFYEKREQGSDKVTPQYKYQFLIGDFDKGMLNDPILQSYTADHELLKGTEKFMDKVKVKVRIVTSFEKNAAGKFQQVQKPVYTIVDLNV